MPLRFLNPNFHVILIHYPLGVFVLGVVLELFGFLWRGSSLRTAARWMIVLGALLTLPAATSGVAALHDVVGVGLSGGQKAMLYWHVIYMGIASILAALCAVIGLGATDRWRKLLYFPLLLGVVGAWGLMVLGAYQGGETIFRQGTAVTIPMKTTPATTMPTTMPADTVASAGQKVDFETQVRPIIADTCYKCHAGDKHKGELKLDSPERIRKGGKEAGAKVLVAGNPGKSDLVRRISLPTGDDDVMPPEGKGEHLTGGQVDLIKAWITQGADFGLSDTSGPTTLPSAVSLTSDESHHDLKLAIEEKDYKELMDYWGGGAIQQHTILAGIAFAIALLALGLSIRRLHSNSVVKETPIKIEPHVRGEGERRRVAEDENLLRSFNPRAAIQPPPAKPKTSMIPSGRLWLLAVVTIVMTAGLGYWQAAGSQHVFTPDGWTSFVGKLKSADPVIKVNHVAAHVILGGALLVLSLLCSLLAAFAPRRPLMLGIFGVLLVAVIAAQTWVGVLRTFQRDKPDASLFHFQTAEEAKAQDEREAAIEKAKMAPAAPATPSETTPATPPPDTAPATPTTNP